METKLELVTPATRLFAAVLHDEFLKIENRIHDQDSSSDISVSFDEVLTNAVPSKPSRHDAALAFFQTLGKLSFLSTRYFLLLIFISNFFSSPQHGCHISLPGICIRRHNYCSRSQIPTAVQQRELTPPLLLYLDISSSHCENTLCQLLG